MNHRLLTLTIASVLAVLLTTTTPAVVQKEKRRREPVHMYCHGNEWSDEAAVAACKGFLRYGDMVTIGNGTNFAATKQWDGNQWIVPPLISAGQLVCGSMVSTKVH